MKPNYCCEMCSFYDEELDDIDWDYQEDLDEETI